jgi:hypothetical protein
VETPLSLGVPERQKPDRNSFSISPRKVEHWLDTLPKANLGETARLVYKALIETNQLDLSSQDRLRFLESMRETVQYITDSMRKHFFGITYPLPEKNLKIAAATREIFAAMATGYKIAIEDTCNNSVLFQDKKQLTLLVHRAISYTGRVLLNAYQIYAPYPPGHWQNLHKLYQFAESRKILKLSIHDFLNFYVEKSTITDEYKRSLLLWLAAPYHLRQGEVTKVFNTLERWVRHVDILITDQPQHPEQDGQFGIRFNEDEPPYAFLHSTRWCRENNCRVLNTDRLTARLEQDIQDSKEVVNTTLTGIDMGRPDLSHDLLCRLMVSWGINAKRTFPRTSKREEVQVAVGLSVIHQSLTQDRQNTSQEETGFEHRAEYASSMIASVNQETRPDVWNMIYPTEEQARLTNIVTEELTLADDSKPEPIFPSSKQINAATAPAQLDHWVIMNESASGYCLEYADHSNTLAQVGELVGIRRRLSNSSWKWGIGVIRWMKFSANRHLQLGVQMLNPDAAAIGMRTNINTDDRQAELQRTLLLPEIPAIKQPSTLITGPAPWRVGNKLVLNILGRDIRVELTRLVQNTGLFAQFQFGFMDDNKVKASQEDTQNDQDFGQVWSSI